MTIKATGTWHFGFSSTVRLGNLEAMNGQPVSPEPVPADVDLAVAALVGCTCTMLSAVAREMDFWYNGIDFVGRAEFCIDNLSGADGPVRRFEAVRGTVTVRTDEDQERLDDLAAEVRRRCRVFAILEKAGITADIEWKKAGTME
jgi:uncharacterized OsmC-like protein